MGVVAGLLSDMQDLCVRADAEIAHLTADNERLRAALEWYAEQVGHCRKIGTIPEGEAARHALSKDGGERARQALTTTADGGGDEDER